MPRRFEVLKIHFRMITGVVLGHPWMFLDSLLKHLVLRIELGDEYYDLPSKHVLDDLVEKARIPIAEVHFDNDYFYDCSVSIIDGNFYPYKYMDIIHVRKRIFEKHIQEPSRAPRSVEIGKGMYKMFDIKLMYVPCREVQFLANAVEDEIIELLRHVNFLGKKRGIGYGRVRDVTYDKTELKHAYYLPDSTVTRPVPAQVVDTVETVRRFGRCELIPQTYRPPYWDSRRYVPCTVPGRKYVVKLA